MGLPTDEQVPTENTNQPVSLMIHCFTDLGRREIATLGWIKVVYIHR